MKIAEFDVIPMENIYEWIGLSRHSDEDNQEPLYPNFEMIGLETTLFIYNVGSMLLVILLYPLLILISIIDSRLRCKRRNSKLSNKFSKFVFWNQPIVTMQEAYLMLALSCLINLHYLKWDNILE
jgi:UDP-N-acetylmuramyl pentapeptide phosphotransferase/UDP-N-acetylglucosamine-1-phosphate transferase